MENKPPIILIIFGISGDLAGRYLLPAIGAIADAGMMPEHFHILGVTRQSDISIDSLLGNTANTQFVRDHLSLYQMDVGNIEEYDALDEYIADIEKNFSVLTERMFYLSVPPQVALSIVECIGKSKLSNPKKLNTKLLLEKPFGVDLQNAKEMAGHIDKYFMPEQIYRVDHYMAKETAQNIIVFRSGNSLFKKTWNHNFIERIEIVASEEIGIEGRAHFYEQTGALRDIVQSHLLQLLALTLMQLPHEDTFDQVPTLRLAALKQLHISDIKNAVRGQYEGYTDEVKNPGSTTETFVSITLLSDDPHWVGVPLTLTTGKALKNKLTEIRIFYKKDKESESNELVLRLQPEEGIQFNMWAKHPGYEHRVSAEKLAFKFKERFDALPQAYEQVIYSAINSDHSLFTTSEEILETWRILDALQKSWEKNKEGLLLYKKGSTIIDVFGGTSII